LLLLLPPTPKQTLPLNKATLSSVGAQLGKDPIHFVAVIKLKEGSDINKFVAVREAVAKKAQEKYPGVKVAYVKVGGVFAWRANQVAGAGRAQHVMRLAAASPPLPQAPGLHNTHQAPCFCLLDTQHATD
jgi:hypothetical protein